MDDSVKILHLQQLLLAWMSNFEKRSYTSIKESCAKLAESYRLSISKPTEEIFWPLVYNGLVDYAGRNYYAVTEPLIIECKIHYYCINFIPTCKHINCGIAGVCKTTVKPTETEIKTVTVSAVTILRHFPTIKEVVCGFPDSLVEVRELEFYGLNKNGVAKYRADGLTKFFYDTLNSKLYEIPNSNVNPESFSIAYCYGRAINNENNGLYNRQTAILRFRNYAMPFSIYRSLLIESMNNDILPQRDGEYYIFKMISKEVVDELNRIFCNSIRYE